MKICGHRNHGRSEDVWKRDLRYSRLINIRAISRGRAELALQTLPGPQVLRLCRLRARREDLAGRYVQLSYLHSSRSSHSSRLSPSAVYLTPRRRVCAMQQLLQEPASRFEDMRSIAPSSSIRGVTSRAFSALVHVSRLKFRFCLLPVDQASSPLRRSAKAGGSCTLTMVSTRVVESREVTKPTSFISRSRNRAVLSRVAEVGGLALRAVRTPAQRCWLVLISSPRHHSESRRSVPSSWLATEDDDWTTIECKLGQISCAPSHGKVEVGLMGLTTSSWR